jgi:hypothetical protein
MTAYLLVYLGIGVGVVLVALAAAWSDSEHPLSLRRELADGCPYQLGMWRYRFQVTFLGTVLPPILLAMAIVAWPALILMKAKDILRSRREAKEAVFTVTRRHLVRAWTIPEIEDHERVDDPLRAVPAVPFGFLNPAWLAFFGSMEPGDVIWSFGAVWKSGWRHEHRTGYALVRGKRVGQVFVTGFEPLED